MSLFTVLMALVSCISLGQVGSDKVNESVSLEWRQFRLDSLFAWLYELGAASQETPIVIHFAHGYTLARYQCLAYYSDSLLDILTFEKPFITTPDSMHTSINRQLCVRYLPGIAINFFNAFVLLNKYEGELLFMQLFLKYNLTNPYPSFSVIDDVINCNKSKNCLIDVADEYNYSPYIMASIIMDGIIDEVSNNGWNMHGLIKLNENNEEVECTANCIPYSDYTGYKPKLSQKKKNKNNWQPLLETDGHGFLYRHEHVTPHIGIKGKRYLLNKYKQAVNPNYDYKKEGMDLILRLKELATSDYQKMAVEVFDDKLNVRAIILDGLHKQYPVEMGESFEMTRLFSTGISFAEYEAVLQAWNQKIKYDLIRPTTVIQRWGDIDIETYGGPYQGVKTIKAHDFEPYIRVMPHSEYPSGSACLCKAYQEYTDAFVEYYFGDESVYNLSISIPAGASKVESGVTPKTDIEIVMEDMNELLYICSESRLWGGMHFRKSVDEAIRICDGIGTKAFELIQTAINGQEYD